MPKLLAARLNSYSAMRKAILAMLMVTSVAACGTTETTAATSSEPPANVLTTAMFSAVGAIPHTSDAIAVGSYSSTGGSGEIIDEWNGNTWEQMKPRRWTAPARAVP
jgi:predicted house-cleaning NTP pyrophosphatase (Maf/HAM1 superfamily)